MGGIAGTGVTVLADVKAHKADPGPPPETFGEYKKKGEESNGVNAMIDSLIEVGLRRVQQEGSVSNTHQTLRKTA